MAGGPMWIVLLVVHEFMLCHSFDTDYYKQSKDYLHPLNRRKADLDSHGAETK